MWPNPEGAPDAIQNIILYRRGNFCLTERAKNAVYCPVANTRGLCHVWLQPVHGSRWDLHTMLIVLHTKWFQTFRLTAHIHSPFLPVFSSVRSAYYSPLRPGSVMWLPRSEPLTLIQAWLETTWVYHICTQSHTLAAEDYRKPGHTHTLTLSHSVELWPLLGSEDYLVLV